MGKILFSHQLKRRKFKLYLTRKFKSDLFNTSLYSVGRVFSSLFKLKKNLLKIKSESVLNKKIFLSSVKRKSDLYYLRNIIGCNHTRFRRFYRRLSVYGTFLFEKQRLRSFYGEVKEFYFKKFAVKFGPKFFIPAMESRLDVFLFRTGFFRSYSQIKQFINHGFVYVNNKPITNYRFFLPVRSEVTLDSRLLKNLFTAQTNFWLKSKWFHTSNSFFFGSFAEFSPSLGKFFFYKYPSEADLYFPFKLNLNKVLNYYTHSVKF